MRIVIRLALLLGLAGLSPATVLGQSRVYLAEYKFNDPKLYRMNLDGSGIDGLAVIPAADWLVVGLYVDAAGGKVYWTRGGFPEGAIRRANLDGSNVETILSGLTEPRGLDVDLAGGKVYWSDTQDNRMYRANLDGTGLQPVVDTGMQLGHPRLDPANGKVYYGDFGSREIRRCNLDGSSNELLFGANVGQAYDIALDLVAGKLYWIDVFANYLARANLDGTAFEILYGGPVASSGLIEIEIDVAANKIYWADEITDAEKGVWRADLDGSNAERIFASPAGWNAGALHLAGPAPPVVSMALTLGGALNLRSLGRWVTAYLQPPADFDASTIDVNSIQLHGNVTGADPVPVDPAAPSAIGDENGDQVPDLMVKFGRAAVELSLSEGVAVPVTVTGTVAAQSFSGTTALKVLRAPVTAPTAGSVLNAGTVTMVQWQTPAGVEIQSVALLSSLDDGTSWSLEAKGIPSSGSYAWTVPGVGSERARVAVVAVESADASGYVVEGVLGVSEAFTILEPVGVGERAQVEFALRGVRPNPGHGALHVDFSLASGRPARLEVLDVTGRRVMAREVGALGPGRHRVEVRSGLHAGVYLVRLTEGDKVLAVRAAVLD